MRIGKDEPMIREPVYLIVRNAGTRDGQTCWVPLQGRRYKSKERAEKALAKLRREWQQAAGAGRIHPSWKDRFDEIFRLIEVLPGETKAQAIARQLGGVYGGIELQKGGESWPRNITS